MPNQRISHLNRTVAWKLRKSGLNGLRFAYLLFFYWYANILFMKSYRLSFPVKDLVVTIAYFLIFLLFIFIPSSWSFLFFFLINSFPVRLLLLAITMCSLSSFLILIMFIILIILILSHSQT